MKPSSTRLLYATLLAALAVAAVALVLRAGPDAPPVQVHVEVVQRDGTILHAGNVTAATALESLLAAADAGGFDLEVQTGFACTDAYVVAVAGVGQEGTGGWTFQVRQGGTWSFPGESAACCALAQGDHVRWLWSEEGTLGPPCRPAT